MTNGGDVRAERADLETIAPLRDAFRAGAACQIVRDSILPRGFAEPWALRVDGALAGYAGVWTEHFAGRVMELVVAPDYDDAVERLVEALVARTGARRIECQTNLPRQAELFERLATEVEVEHLLFEEGPATELDLPGARVVTRETWSENGGGADGPEGEWLVVRDDAVVAAGGVLTHYNPPFADLYMEVVPEARRRGVGSFLVQELRRAARRRGLVPAARCDPENEGSRRTLLRGGLVPSGRLLSGTIAVG